MFPRPQIALVCVAMLAGCAEARDDGPRWYESETAPGVEATLDQWARASVEDQLATAAFLAARTFEFDDEYAWVAAASTIQECINGYALDAADGSRPMGMAGMAALCTLAMEPRRGMRAK